MRYVKHTSASATESVVIVCGRDSVLYPVCDGVFYNTLSKKLP